MLTPRQARVANALAKGATITEAAASAGLHRATIYKWLKTKKQFQAALGDARGAYQIALRKELQDLSHTVFATLHALLTDPKATVAVRQRLALAFLERCQFADAQPDNIPPADLSPDR
ncbi:MAG: helix-turn-helix domain-containing protein [Bryobacteraceae bacterium]